MPRANRYFLPGQIWHITHRCHKREFLLKFAREPEEWECCGYHEIGQPPRRYARIDRHQLAALLELPNPEGLAEWQQSIHTIAQAEVERRRCPEWTESIAVGREEYVAAIQDKLGLKARSRTVQRASPAGMHVLRESPSAYNSVFCPENARLSSGNHIPWDVIS